MEIGLGPVLTNESWRARPIEGSTEGPEVMMGRVVLPGRSGGWRVLAVGRWRFSVFLERMRSKQDDGDGGQGSCENGKDPGKEASRGVKVRSKRDSVSGAEREESCWKGGGV